jgi:hypothetical protein
MEEAATREQPHGQLLPVKKQAFDRRNQEIYIKGICHVTQNGQMIRQ